MVGDHTEGTGKSCNVCGSEVQIVNHAASQCSNYNCETRDRDSSLSTNSDPSEIIEHFRNEARSSLSQDTIKEEALKAFKQYIRADSRSEAEDAEIRTDVYLSHLNKGWGWLKEESDAV